MKPSIHHREMAFFTIPRKPHDPIDWKARALKAEAEQKKWKRKATQALDLLIELRII